MSDSKSVLVVDDHPASLKQIQTVFDQHDFNYAIQPNSNDAIRQISSGQAVSLVVIRFQSDQIDGVELCQELRRHRSAGFLHILMIVSDNQPEQIAVSLAAGANDIIVEPFSRSELLIRCRNKSRRVTRKIEAGSDVESIETATAETTSETVSEQPVEIVDHQSEIGKINAVDDFASGIFDDVDQDDQAVVEEQSPDDTADTVEIVEPNVVQPLIEMDAQTDVVETDDFESVESIEDIEATNSSVVFRVHQADNRFGEQVEELDEETIFERYLSGDIEPVATNIETPAEETAEDYEQFGKFQEQPEVSKTHDTVEPKMIVPVEAAQTEIPKPNIAIRTSSTSQPLQPNASSSDERQIEFRVDQQSPQSETTMDQSQPQIVQPYFDAESQRYLYPPEAAQFIEQWNNDPNVIKLPLDSVMTCPECSAVPGFRFGCGECGSGSTEQEILIHHFACACVASEREFRNDRNFVCPKCRVGGLVAGTDFEVTPGCYQCSDCFASVDQPALIGHCMMCALRFPASEAGTMQLVAYQLPVNHQQPVHAPHEHSPRFTSVRKSTIQRR